MTSNASPPFVLTSVFGETDATILIEPTFLMVVKESEYDDVSEL